MILIDRSTGETFEYTVQTDSNGRIQAALGAQKIQEMIFHKKRSLIENCLFGVDLNPNSVKICRLRLWIELLKHAYYEDGALETLPNIDINIKRGNSLISRFDLGDPLTGALAEQGLSLGDYRIAVKSYHRATKEKEKQRLLHLIEQIKGGFRSHIGRRDPEKVKLLEALGNRDRARADIDAAERFGLRDQRVERRKKNLKMYEKQVTRLAAEIAKIESNVIYEEAFEWRFEFPAVLDDEGQFIGFDVVVGNPPYVRQEDLANVKPYLRKHYEVYAGTADLLVYFIELSMNLLQPGGQFAFIVANKFMRAGYGKALRRYIPQFRVHQLLDFGDLPVFDEATTYPLILTLEKAPPRTNFTAATLTELDPTTFREHLSEVKFDSLHTGLIEDGYILADIPTQRLLAKLKATCSPLKEYIGNKIYRGVVTGYNEAFVIDAGTRERLIAKDPISADIIKPYLAGREVSRYVPPVSMDYLVFTRRGIDIDAYPAIKEHLDQFQKGLEPKPKDWPRKKKWPGRKSGPYQWYEIQDSVNYYESFEQPKIFYQEIMTYQSFTYDAEGIYSNNKLFIMPGASLNLLGLLNSKVIWLCLKNSAASYSGGALGMQSPFVLALPVPAGFSDAQRIEANVRRILELKRSDASADTSILEAEIDIITYTLYGLDYGEVLIVDPEFKMSEDDYIKYKTVVL